MRKDWRDCLGLRRRTSALHQTWKWLHQTIALHDHLITLTSSSSSKLTTVRKFSGAVVAVNGAASLRQLSTEKKTQRAALTKNEDEITKSVFISQSNDVFTNLAIEDWLYRNTDFDRHHVLLVWRNAPCVVIGRHQNPWLESDMGFLAEKGIDVARRNSGGGTVYHDKGNLNLSFFTPRERYNRKDNLKIITRAICREWGLDLEISEKDDLLLDDHKISGTASKLGRPNAYHHCTLLVSANKSDLKTSLSKNLDEIETNATRSVASRVKNLTDANREITFERLLAAIGWEYLRTTPVSARDGGRTLVGKQRGFQLINPTDQWFPGLNAIRDEYLSWNWRFGKTPRFSVSRTFPVVHDPSGKVENPNIQVTLEVEKGEIADVLFKLPAERGDSVTATSGLLSSLQGKKFSSQTFDAIQKSLVVVEKKEEAKAALRA